LTLTDLYWPSKPKVTLSATSVLSGFSLVNIDMPVRFNTVARSANHNEKPALEPGSWRSGMKFAPGLERPNANSWTTSKNRNAATSETWRGINSEPMPQGPYPKPNRKKIALRESAVFQNAASANANTASANANTASANANTASANSRRLVNSRNNAKNTRNTKRLRTGAGRKTR